MVSSRKDLKLLCNPSCDFQNLFRLGAAINFDRYANENSLPPPPAAARRLAPARSACRGFISFDLKPKQKDTRRCLFVLATNAFFDTGCIGLQSCIEMQPKKCMQPTDKLEFMGAKQILDWGTQILLSIRLPEIQIFCTAPLVQSLFHHFHETLTP